ncbi:hypothetical protein DFH08DRAFT_810420 [Mycena albidolilacea]|uniref:Uncharacterized protein n=1 Tax=Mycena albidolilacea TaxID=1033008 RepID=A0AAD7EPH8_9AGAR|nr:hypothetical protein DFH08DRAFT_810420 [Mycena albidolilacea]
MKFDANGAEVPDNGVDEQDSADEEDDELPDLIYNVEDFNDFALQHGPIQVSITPAAVVLSHSAIVLDSVHRLLIQQSSTQNCVKYGHFRQGRVVGDLNTGEYCAQESDFMIHSENVERFWVCTEQAWESLSPATAVPKKLSSSAPKL